MTLTQLTKDITGFTPDIVQNMINRVNIRNKIQLLKVPYLTALSGTVRDLSDTTISSIPKKLIVN